MSRCIWVDYVYKLLLTLVGAAMVTPGMGQDVKIPQKTVSWTRDNERCVQAYDRFHFVMERRNK